VVGFIWFVGVEVAAVVVGVVVVVEVVVGATVGVAGVVVVVDVVVGATIGVAGGVVVVEVVGGVTVVVARVVVVVDVVVGATVGVAGVVVVVDVVVGATVGVAGVVVVVEVVGGVTVVIARVVVVTRVVVGTESTSVMSAGMLVIPCRLASIKAVPVVKPLAKPVGEMFTPVLLLCRSTLEVTSSVEPSEYMAMAVNCLSEPMVKSADNGSTSMETKIAAADVGVDVILGRVEVGTNAVLVTLFPVRV
jgi:hypothetical protein